MPQTPYNEPAIIAIITEYYNLLFSLSYLSPEELDFAPPQGREINQTLCDDLSLSPAVVSLMRHLPCPCSEGIMLDHELLLPRSHATSFVDTNLIKLSRDPEQSENLWFLGSTDIALSIMGDEGRYLVLDTGKSIALLVSLLPYLLTTFAFVRDTDEEGEIDTIRVCEWEPPCPPHETEDKDAKYEFEVSSPEDQYTRFPIHDPVEFLQSIIDKLRDLEWLPRRLYGVGTISTDGPGYEKTKRILIDEYGWPDDFKQDEWKRNCKRILHDNV